MCVFSFLNYFYIAGSGFDDSVYKLKISDKIYCLTTRIPWRTTRIPRPRSGLWICTSLTMGVHASDERVLIIFAPTTILSNVIFLNIFRCICLRQTRYFCNVFIFISDIANISRTVIIWSVCSVGNGTWYMVGRLNVVIAYIIIFFLVSFWLHLCSCHAFLQSLTKLTLLFTSSSKQQWCLFFWSSCWYSSPYQKYFFYDTGSYLCHPSSGKICKLFEVFHITHNLTGLMVSL